MKAWVLIYWLFNGGSVAIPGIASEQACLNLLANIRNKMEVGSLVVGRDRGSHGVSCIEYEMAYHH